MEHEADKLVILVSNAKDVIYNFLNLDNKYRWGRLPFMVQTGAGTQNIFNQIDHIQISEIRHQAHGYFELTGIVNVEKMSFQALW